MALQEPHTDGVPAVQGDGPLDVEHVPNGLGHLVRAPERHHAVMRPGTNERTFRMCGGALGKLVLVVREANVRAAAVDVSPVRQVFAYHRGAFDVPAGTSGAPGALPGGLATLGGFPQGEVKRAPLVSGLSLLRLAHLIGALVAQCPVGWETTNGVVDVAVGFFRGVGVAPLYEVLDQGDHLRYVLGGPRLDVWHAYAKHAQSFMKRVRVTAYDLLPRDALFVGSAYDLVFYIRDVLDERHVVAPAPQIPDDHVPEQRRPRVADVDVVVDGRPADVEPEQTSLPDLDHVPAQTVLYEYAHDPSLAPLAPTIRSRASTEPSTAKR